MKTMYHWLKIGRNDPCPCGSGIKFKKCCLNKPYKPSKELMEDLKLGQEMAKKLDQEMGIDRTISPKPVKKSFPGCFLPILAGLAMK